MKKNLNRAVSILSVIGLAFFLSATIPIVAHGFPLKASQPEIQRLCIGCGLLGIVIWMSEMFLIKVREKIARIVGHAVAWSMGLSGVAVMITALFFM